MLAYRELDDALGLSAMACEMIADARTGKIPSRRATSRRLKPCRKTSCRTVA